MKPELKKLLLLNLPYQDLIRSCPEYQKLWKAAQDSAEWKVHTAKEGA